ncbi:MAG: hypothetical protein WAM47_15540, partial [Candidatus Sulfotelmatobacter sp.]
MKKAAHEDSRTMTKLWTLLATFSLLVACTGSRAFASAAPGIKIVGNQFVTTSAGTLGLESVSANEAVVLRGINI